MTQALKEVPMRSNELGRATVAVLALAIATSCHAYMGVSHTVPAPANPADSVAFRGDAVRIMEVLAERHRLARVERLDRGYLAEFSALSQRPGDPIIRTVVLWIRHGVDGGLTFGVSEGPSSGVSEGPSSDWSPMGDSLRQELADTLRARFGQSVVNP
jgi:hypothetical protein